MGYAIRDVEAVWEEKRNPNVTVDEDQMDLERNFPGLLKCSNLQIGNFVLSDGVEWRTIPSRTIVRN